MRKIKIEITKSKLESFHVSIDEEDKLQISTTIGLYTERNRKISSFSLSSDAWDKKNQIELPIDCIVPIRKIIDELELLTTLKCREGQNLLASSNA